MTMIFVCFVSSTMLQIQQLFKIFVLLKETNTFHLLFILYFSNNLVEFLACKNSFINNILHNILKCIAAHICLCLVQIYYRQINTNKYKI